jgi:hypothetical protein
MQLGATTTGYYGNRINMDTNSTTVTGGSINNAANISIGFGTDKTLIARTEIQNPFLAKRTFFASVRGTSDHPNTVGWVNGVLDNNTSYTDFSIFGTSNEPLTGGVIRVYGYQNS